MANEFFLFERFATSRFTTFRQLSQLCVVQSSAFPSFINNLLVYVVKCIEFKVNHCFLLEIIVFQWNKRFWSGARRLFDQFTWECVRIFSGCSFFSFRIINILLFKKRERVEEKNTPNQISTQIKRVEMPRRAVSNRKRRGEDFRDLKLGIENSSFEFSGDFIITKRYEVRTVEHCNLTS